MASNVTLPFDGDFEALRRTLAAWGFEVGERPHAPVFAQGHGVTIHAYHTGKLLLSGPRAEEWARELRQEVKPKAAPKAAPEAKPSGWTVHFDGACMPQNPGGIAAYGFQVLRDGRVVHEGSGLAAPPGPLATNNVAEFTGLIEALRWLKTQGVRGALVRGDSEFVVEAVTGKKAVRAPHLVPLRDDARRLLAELDARIEWVPREENGEADRLSRVGYEAARRAHPEWRI